MHLQAHALSGWCLARHLNLTAKERFLAMLAACLPDLDALSAVFFGELRLDGFRVIASGPNYQATHHVLGHNLFAAILIAAMCTYFSRRSLKIFCLYLAMVHLHLALDLLGSGAGWGVRYFWPLSEASFEIAWGWDLISWQNIASLMLLVIWMLWLMRKYQSTPIEFFAPKLDKKLTGYLNAFVER